VVDQTSKTLIHIDLTVSPTGAAQNDPASKCSPALLPFFCAKLPANLLSLVAVRVWDRCRELARCEVHALSIVTQALKSPNDRRSRPQ
jgi:hypothetical protein